ncbi:hypothetical protein B7P43_G09313 [Cryptotermes secundus]|uniref:Uncharacterized protein n=1 Tax=Cryptotermes secundus TaxID=105785 RepID=A0A2J7RRQ6_9NEOP|nr:hypothetical protein B7P43_G09313 [Cryptotermes secundus]
MHVKTEKKTSRFRINTGNLTGVNSDCLLLATAEEDLTVFHRLPDQHIGLGVYGSRKLGRLWIPFVVCYLLQNIFLMRKTRLIILPARCLAMIGFLLLYLACPILAEMSRGKPDRGLASSFQLEVLEHCASPPEDPGEGGCADSRNALAKMTRTVPPDNEHDNTCSTTDVFLLENTCTVDQRPAENVHGHSRQAKRYANASPRRLLAARSTDPTAAVVKIQAPRHQVKYRSLKRREVPDVELAVTSQQQGITTRTLLSVESAARIASERTDTVRRALSMEHDEPKETAKKLLSRRIPELEASRRMLAERQYPSRTVPDSRALVERDISRRQSRERQASRRTMERGMFQIDGSRRFTFERQSFRKLSADRRVSESDVSTRTSTERKSSLRTSTDHRMFEPDAARRSSVARQSERRMSTERRISEPAASRLSEKRESSRRLLTDRRMLEYSPYRRMSIERQSSRSLVSDRISKIRFESMASSERSFSGTRSSRSPTTDIRQDGSRKTRLGIRTLSEEIQGSRVSKERLYPERRSISRAVQPEERRHYAEKSFSRRNSLDEARRISAERLTPERNTGRSPERLASVRDSRISVERLTPERNTGRSPERLASVRDSRISAERLAPERNTGRSPERLTSVRDSRISAERLAPERNTRRSPQRMASVRDSRISVERLTPERNTRRSPERLASVRDSRISVERLTPERNTRRSPERLASVRDSRISVERLTPERNTRRSPERLTSVRDSRIYAERLTSERNARRSPERLASVRDPRISAERLTPERNTRRSPEHLASVRYSRISAERLTPERNTRRSPERLASVRDPRISAERLTPERNTRRSPESPTSVRHYKKFSAERLTSKRQSRRSTEVTSSVRDLTRNSPEQMVSARDSRRYAERLALVTNIRTVSVNRMAFGENSRRSVERSVSLRNSRQISTRSSRSADPTVTVLGTRSSAERSVSERDSRRSAERLAPVTISRVYTERVAFVRRSVGSWALGRDFRRGSTVPLAFEVDIRRSVERLANNINSRTSAQLVSQMESRKSVNYSSSLRKPDSLTSARKFRTSVERMSFVKMVNGRRSVLKQYSTDRFATKKLTARASNRAVFSERLVSQPEQVSIIRFTLKAPEHYSTNRMTNVRNTKLSYGHISNNQDLYQSFGLSERRFITMDNTTLKTESLLSIGLPLGTIQKSILNFMPAQYSSWTDKITEYVRCALATLTLFWPALTIWKGNALEYLTSLDVILGFSTKMDRFNSFFADKPTSNCAFVPDDLALIGSTKPAPAVMR